MRFVLAFWNLVNSTYPRHCDTKMLMVCIKGTRACACTPIYIRRGLRCCCLDTKAIPEPQNAEQQDCSPAFLLYPFAQHKDRSERMWRLKQDHHGTMFRGPYKENNRNRKKAPNSNVRNDREMVAEMKGDWGLMGPGMNKEYLSNI